MPPRAVRPGLVASACAIAALGATAAGPASAADPGPTADVVFTLGGEALSGRAIEIVPGSHVTIELPGGEQRRLQWSGVDRIVVGVADAPDRPPPAADPAPPADAPLDGPLVRVHVTSSRVTYLYRRPEGSTDFLRACESPCDLELPLGDTYKIGGSGITTSKDFRLSGAPGGTVSITVDGPSWVGIVGGGVLALSGIGIGYVGLLFALTGTAIDSRSGDAVRNLGLGMLIVGGAMIAVGIFVVLPSTATDVTQKAKDAFVRTPAWRVAREPTLAPPTFPLLFERTF
jgi:hypothetical protein